MLKGTLITQMAKLVKVPKMQSFERQKLVYFLKTFPSGVRIPLPPCGNIRHLLVGSVLRGGGRGFRFANPEAFFLIF